ncbi:MAG: SPOR domain-containing protein [Deltaproteobacteria bacterium]|nr:SPOR domain-containing protein [Deltaproteobacteria bacterium]
MHCKRKLGERLKIRCFGGMGRVFAVVLAGVLACTWGCSGGEEQPPEEKNKVVVAIKRPMPKPAPEEKVEPPPVPQKQPEPAVVEKETAPREGESVAQEEQPAPQAAAAAKPGSVETQAPAELLKKSEPPKLEKGFVRVREGESLSAVAARQDVYGDFLKWPGLYRLNVERLAMIQTWEDVKKKPLPAGLSLRYVSPGEERKSQSPFQPRPWVVTIRSWQTPGRLAAPAIKLIQNGYNVYIARAVVKDKPWLRLRVGFYRSKSEALAAKEKIGEILGNNDAWIARAGKTELETFSRE